MKLFTFFCIFTASLMAQPVNPSTTPQVPAGLVYQAAIAVGLQPISPVSGQAIINERAALNWKTVSGQVLGPVALGVLLGGISGVIPMGKLTQGILGGVHGYYDGAIAPLIARAAPNPNDIPAVIQVTGMVAPSTGACFEGSMYVSPSKVIRGGGPINVGGLAVTFSVQSPQVLKHAGGGIIKKFQVVDVIACIPIGPLPAPPAPVPVQLRPPNFNQGVVIPSTFNQPGAVIHINPNAAAGIDAFRAALKLANAAIEKDPDNPALFRTEAILLKNMGEYDLAEIAEGISAMKQERLSVLASVPKSGR
jgi:hypothetical protein